MAGPAFNLVGTRVQSAGAATLTPTKPAGSVQAGACLAVVTSKNNAVHATVTPGWTPLGQVNSGASFTASLWIGAGNATNPVFTWTGSVACSAQIFYYDDPANVVVSNAIGATSNNNGLTATHSTTSVNTTRNNSLMVYIDVAAANTAIATPAGWTEDADAGSATDAGRTAGGSKAVATSGTASGAISVTGANAAWVQWQLELLPQSAPVAFQSSEVEMGALLQPPASFDANEVEIGAWLDYPTRFEASEVEIGAWLDVATSTARRHQAGIIN